MCRRSNEIVLAVWRFQTGAVTAFDVAAKDSKDDLISHIMTRNLNANDDTFEAKGSNVVSFAKAKAARQVAPMAFEGLRLAA